MIREALRFNTAYAVLHPSVHDRSKARRFVVTAANKDARPHDVYGYFTDEYGQQQGHEWVPVRSIRAPWYEWTQGVTTKHHPYQRQPKHLADWLRRIERDPDASPLLRDAALRQLETIR